MPGSQQRSNASGSLIIGLAAAVILALGVGVLVYTRQPAQSSPPASGAPPASAATAPSAAPVPASEAPAGAPDAQRPATTQAAQQAPPATAARGGAQPPTAGSAPGGRSEAAPRKPERPTPDGAKPAQAAPPAPPPLTAQAMLRRGFVASRTASENIRGVSKTLSGFDSRKAKEVTVKRAPDVDGRLEFSSTPVKVKPGDKYTVRVSLINEGKRAIEIREVEVVTTINRKLTSTSVKPLVKQVSPRQNEVIHELSGTWDKGTTSFSVGVRVMSDRLDLYRNQLVWK